MISFSRARAAFGSGRLIWVTEKGIRLVQASDLLSLRALSANENTDAINNG